MAKTPAGNDGDGRLFSPIHTEATRTVCEGAITFAEGKIKGAFEVAYLLHRGPLIEVLSTESSNTFLLKLPFSELDEGTMSAISDNGRSVRCAEVHKSEMQIPSDRGELSLLLSTKAEADSPVLMAREEGSRAGCPPGLEGTSLTIVEDQGGVYTVRKRKHHLAGS